MKEPLNWEKRRARDAEKRRREKSVSARSAVQLLLLKSLVREYRLFSTCALRLPRLSYSVPFLPRKLAIAILRFCVCVQMLRPITLLGFFLYILQMEDQQDWDPFFYISRDGIYYIRLRRKHFLVTLILYYSDVETIIWPSKPKSVYCLMLKRQPSACCMTFCECRQDGRVVSSDRHV